MFNSFYRGYSIFARLGTKNYKKGVGNTYDQLFLSEFNISLHNYYLCILLYATHITHGDSLPNSYYFKKESFYLKIRNIDIKNQLEQLVVNLSTTPDKLTTLLTNNNKDDKELAFKRALRDTPIIDLPDGLSVLSDATYFIDDFISKGILFCLSKMPDKTSNTVFANYGDCFESYVGELLEMRHQTGELTKHTKLSHNKGKNETDELEVDFLVELDNNTKIIYEIKAVLINESNELMDEIEKKYDKAIKQLTNRINCFKENNNIIYPVLVVQDKFIATCEFLLKENLKKELALCELKKEKTIHPLIIISVETLELLPVTVDLFVIFKEYHDIKNNQGGIGDNFCDFISSPEYKYGTDTSEKTLDKMTELLSETQKRMFGAV